LNIGSNYVGICIAAVNFAALLTATPLGRLSDYLGSARYVGSAAAAFCCIGNILYLTVPNIIFIVLSRVFSGIGSGLEPILFGLLGRSYAPEERSNIFSQHMLAREMGLIFGPLLNLGFDKVDFVLYCKNTCLSNFNQSASEFFKYPENSMCLNSPDFSSPESCSPFLIRLNKYTMPACFLAIAWLILILCLLIFYNEPTPVEKAQRNLNEDLTKGFELDTNKTIVKNGHGESEVLLQKSNGSKMVVTGSMRSAFDFENPYLSITRSNYSLGGTSPNRVDSENPPQSPLVEEREPSPEILHEKSAEPRSMVELVVEETGRKMPYLTEQFVVVMMASFSVMFFESAIEASLTPMTAYFFHWEAKENSLCYVFMGICALLGYVAIMVLQKVKNLEDRTALLVGSIGVTVGLTLGFFGFPLGKYGDTWIFYVFGATVAISVFSLPFLLVPPASLLSKISPQESQSTLQGVRMSFQKVAMVLGPLWGTSTLWNYYVVISAPLGMTLLITILTFLSFKYLRDDRLVPPKTGSK